MKNGDTLYSIGRKFNISVDELKKINNLVSNNLSIGQKLKLNNKQNQNNPIYIVQRGDTLYSISKNNNVSIEDIIEANNLTSNVLSIGQELYIPSENEVIENQKPIENSNDQYSIYTVKKGDSLWLISQRNNITVPELLEINNLNNNILQIGQKLLIPKQSDYKDNAYIVQKGDTLWSIANKFQTTVSKIKEDNNLSSNLLSLGQELIINQ